MLVHHMQQKLKMNRCQLWCKYSMLLSTLLRKVRTFRNNYVLIWHRLSSGQSRHQRSQADAGSTKIAHIIQLYHGIDTLMFLKNGLYLACSDCIQSAAERAELNHGDIVMLRSKMCRMIQSCMVTPLINNF